MESGLRMLARRPHARRELALKLARRGYRPEEVETALSRFSRLGYLDDESFAAALVRRRSPTRGSALVAAELARRGVEREVARGALEGMTDEQQVAAATRIALRVLGSRRMPFAEALRTLGPRLARRGFSGVVVVSACRAAAHHA
ncbi:MAG: regulatory protein RecX [Candidatus Dormibacterales bacterium]